VSLKKRLRVLFLFLCVSLLAFNGWSGEPVRFVVIGDMGCGCEDQQSIADAMLAWHKKNPFKVVLTVGDNIYGSFLGFRNGGSKTLFAEKFDHYYKPLLEKGVKFFATLGNHDMETNSGKDEIADRSRFNILSDKGYYSFSTDPNLITFFALHTNNLVGGQDDPAQLVWLRTALSESKSKWKIVYGHHPLYTAPGKHRVDMRMRKLVEPVLVKNDVRIVFAGHNHFYSRMKPQQSITYFVTGGGGRDLKRPRVSRETEVIARAHHFMYIEVTENELRFWSIDSKGNFLDKGSLPARKTP